VPGKHRVFLSYHTPDHGIARGLADALGRHDPALDVFFDRYDLRAGAFWVPALAEAIGEADAVIVLLGARSPGPWQRLEYFEALGRKAKGPAFPIVPVVLPGAFPRLPFLYQLHQLQLVDPTATEALGELTAALRGATAPSPSEPWRTVNPYRGLLAMIDADADFFFGREQLTADILERLRRGERMLTLVGNSGVGKSSLVQAGVVAALRRQIWPVGDGDRGWPGDLRDSRSWLVLTMKPGERPLFELARAFVAQWTEPTDPVRERLAEGWAENLKDALGLGALLRATGDQFRERFGLPAPGRFVLVVDQGEELYTRASEGEAQRFSEILAAAKAPELSVLASLRSDRYGRFQADAPLFAASTVVDVPPLRAAELHQVVERPPAVLGAGFEDPAMSERVIHSTARQPGALPLLSYLLEDLWKGMQRRGDGILRWSDYPDLVGVKGVLARRAEEFFETCEDDGRAALQRLFTLRLAHVPAAGDVARRRARRDECTDTEWRLVEALAGTDWRLLVTGGRGDRGTAEVAHEVLLRDWERLGQWLEAERGFLVWKGELENDRNEWQRTGNDDGALLRGARLAEAEGWLARRGADMPEEDRSFIAASVEAREQERAAQARRRQRIVGASLAAAVAMAALAVLSLFQWREAEGQRREAERNFEAALGAADGLIFDLAIGLEDVAGMRAETVARILDRASGVYDRLGERAAPVPRLLHSRAAMFMKFTDTYLRLGQLDRAQQAAERSVEIMRNLTTTDPGNAGWQRDLSVSHNNIGDVLVAQGNLPAALESYQASLAIRERLAQADPGNAGWQRDLAFSHWRLAQYGNQPRFHWQQVVSILRELEKQGHLAPADQKWLPVAEKTLNAIMQ
jgi:tetratricopeptide (TPR) repeat protein